MDNDNMVKKQLVKLYRNTRLKLDYAGMGLLTEKQGNEYIKQFANSDAPFLLGRFGAVRKVLYTGGKRAGALCSGYFSQ